MKPLRSALLALLLVTLPGLAAAEDERFVILQSTTSTQNSGLLDAILPVFREKTGIEVRLVAVGTGQALRNARNGDGDVVLVHARAQEDAFVAEGHGVDRRDVMYNDFVIVGPGSDAAGIAGQSDAAQALAKIAEARAEFASRGDDSGTHAKERALWDVAGVDPTSASGQWYLETGSGMGATLNTAVAKGAYTLTDRGTWLSFGNKRDFRVLVEGDARLHNPYGVILVNPERHPHVKAEDGRALIDWLTSEEGQRAIGAFRIDGQVLFFPNAEDR